jgi:hypothetical protein
LAALVPATVEGLVRDVIVLAASDDPGIRRVAEHAGCGLVERDRFEEAMSEGLRRAKSSMIFVVRAGAAFERGFLDEIASLLGPQQGAASPEALLFRQMPGGILARILPDLAPVAGMIATRHALMPPSKDFASLTRRVGRSRTVASRAQMAS